MYIPRHLVLTVITDQEKSSPIGYFQNIKLASTTEMYFIEYQVDFCLFVSGKMKDSC